jgi:hypothetical protein
MSAHTPGPWRVDICTPESGKSIAVHVDTRAVKAGRVMVVALCGRPGVTYVEANARLIAAAPELFAAVKAAEQFFDDQIHCRKPTQKWTEYVAQIRAAIASAEGKKP